MCTQKVNVSILLLTIQVFWKKHYFSPVTQSISLCESLPWAAAMAVMVATSRAADDETPFPSGTAEEICFHMDSSVKTMVLLRIWVQISTFSRRCFQMFCHFVQMINFNTTRKSGVLILQSTSMLMLSWKRTPSSRIRTKRVPATYAAHLPQDVGPWGQLMGNSGLYLLCIWTLSPHIIYLLTFATKFMYMSNQGTLIKWYNSTNWDRRSEPTFVKHLDQSTCWQHHKQ